jgi:hypothetical protein
MESVKAAGKEMRMGTMTDEDVNKIFLERHSRLLMRGKPVTYDNSKNPFKINFLEGFVEKNVLRILHGTARISVTWFSQ